MKRNTLFTLILSLFAVTLSAQPKYEVRAVWLTTIGGIDWPSSYAHNGMGIYDQQQQLCRMLDRLKAINVNTVLLQTRLRATTIYPSELEPWDGCLSGYPGQSPGYDALRFAIDECHRRGMELHAWIVTIPIGKWNSYGCRQLQRRYPGMVKRIDNEGYLNPESYETANYLTRICEEIVSRYDIDGIHLDYIRYPETWRGWKDANNITRIVRSIYQTVKSYKPWVKISCSPIGKFSDLSRYSSRGWNARNTVAQDAQGWLYNGIMDQLYPMMYFRGNNFYPFAIDWQEHDYGRTVVSGLGTYMLSPAEGNWTLEEMKRQLNVTRQLGMGHCHFRAKFLLENMKGIYDYMLYFDQYPALVPPMTWQHTPPPTSPTALWVERTLEGDNLTWAGAQNQSGAPYLFYNIYASTEEQVDIKNPANLIATRRQENFVSVQRKRNARPLYYAVTSVDRYGKESTPIYERVKLKDAEVPYTSTLLPNDGKTLKVPQLPLDAQRLLVYDIQGREIGTWYYGPTLHIGQLPNGMYILKSLNKKRVTHRLGHFVVKR